VSRFCLSRIQVSQGTCKKVSILALLASLFLCASYVTQRWATWTQAPAGVDSFGYARSARIFREYFSGVAPLDFSIRDEQTAFLRDVLKGSGAPPEQWYLAVAPVAHHYVAESDKVVLQYPPGTGFLMSLFPEVEAASLLSQLDVVFVFLVFLGFLIWRARQRSLSVEELWPLYVSVFASMILIDIMTHRSYSIQAAFIPLIVGHGLLLSSKLSRDCSGFRPRPAIEMALLVFAGLCLGFASLCRIPIAFHMLAWVFLLGRSWSRQLAFLSGFAFTFVLPLGLYNFVYTGAFWRSTYPPYDATAPKIAVFFDNLTFYGWAKGSRMNSFLVVAGLSAFFLRGYWTPSKKFFRFVVLLGLPPTLYFLTHEIYIAYYLYPTILLLLWSWAFVHFWHSVSSARPRVSRAAIWLASAFVLGSSVYFLKFHLQAISKPYDPVKEVSGRARQILSTPQAMIWSEFYSGSIVHEFRRPAFKLTQTSPELRKRVYARAREAGFVQYWLMDHEHMKMIRSELQAIGARLVFETKLFGEDFYRIE
jgi:hypothetical protein